MDEKIKATNKCPICGRPTHKESEYCIFHASAEEKTKTDFIRELKKHIKGIKEKNEYYFEKFIFVGNIDFQKDLNIRRFKIANFSEATFEADVNFTNAIFEEEADFSEATFEADVKFGEAIFKVTTEFYKATFKGNADFHKATFKESSDPIKANYDSFANFTDAIFEEEADFSEATFDVRTYFESVIFKHKTNFFNATFKLETNFKNAIFEAFVNFYAVKFKFSPDFHKAIFKADADFCYATFEINIGFSKAIFKRNTYFSEAIFIGDTYFWEAIFEGRAYFSGAGIYSEEDAVYVGAGATFKGEVDFSGIIFKEYADFREATFKEKADFSEATFKEEADFSEAIFEADVKFREATFKEKADFSEATFKEEADFSEAIFEADADFTRESCADADFKSEYWKTTPIFKEIKLSPGKRFNIKIQDSHKIISFERALLENTNLDIELAKNSLIDFTGTLLRNTNMQGRQIKNHILQEDDEEYLLAKKIFLNLKNNFHSIGEYEDENWAFKKEKDMERKSFAFPYYKEALRVEGKNVKFAFLKWIKKGNFLKWIISGFSNIFFGYGLKPWNVIFSAGILILIFALLFSLIGIANPEIIELNGTVIQQSSGNIVNLTSKGLLKNNVTRNFPDSLYFSIITFTTLGYGDFRPLEGLGRILAGSEAFIGAFMMALFVYTFARRTGGR